MRFFALPVLLSVLTYAFAVPTAPAKPLPLLIWHGLGDRYNAEGLHSVGDLAKEIHPGIYVYYVRLDADGSNDSRATFLGNVTEQIEQVCAALHNNTNLYDPATDTIRADALGFSQGGQFLRGLVQRCDGLSVRSLVTFGSQHNGIAQFKACGTWDLVCKGALALAKGNAWTDYVQGHVVPAQYYRTVNSTTGLPDDDYLEHSSFLADINNERALKNTSYAPRLAKLENLVLYVFGNDTTVIPKESGWFADVFTNKTKEEEEERVVTPLRRRTLYKEDWIGLKALDEKGGLVLKTAPGDHMQLDEDVLAAAFKEYLGPDKVLTSWIDKHLRFQGCDEANWSFVFQVRARMRGLRTHFKEFL